MNIDHSSNEAIDQNVPKKQTEQRSVERFRIIYISLLIFRIGCAFLPGYIHPDEFFQGGQELFFGCSGTIDTFEKKDVIGESFLPTLKKLIPESTLPPSALPWEFQSKNAIRSIFPPIFMTLVPLKIYQCLCAFIQSITKIISGQHRHEEMPLMEDYAGQTLSGIHILIIPRIFLAVCSIFFIDFPTWFILQLKQTQPIENKIPYHSQLSSFFLFRKDAILPPFELLVLASSWPILLFSNRTFTNSLETMAVSTLMALVCSDIARERPSLRAQTQTSFFVGVLCSLGLFTRFTFIFFAFPIVLVFLYQRGRAMTPELRSSKPHESADPVENSLSSRFNLRELLSTILWTSLGFLIISVGIILADSQFYLQQQFNETTEARNISKRTHITITPLNALSYNSNANNLSAHGIHPRITHAIVNMPMLFGPLSIVMYFSLLKKTWKLFQTFNIYFLRFIRKRKEPKQERVIGKSTPLVHLNDIDEHDTKVIKLMSNLVIVCGLFVLSCAPHQEPRFLLPLGIPLITNYGGALLKKRNTSNQELNNEEYSTTSEKSTFRPNLILGSCWVVVNMLALCFFGILHQSGVIPSLVALSNYNLIHPTESLYSTPKAVIYFHTYMPPTFISRGFNREGENSCALPLSGSHQLISRMTRMTAFSKHVAMCPSLPIIDLKGSQKEVLEKTFNKILECDSFFFENDDKRDMKVSQNEVTHDSTETVVVIAPTVSIMNYLTKSKDIKADLRSFSMNQYHSQHVWAHKLHISTENMPSWEGKIRTFISELELSAYSISCPHD